MAIATASENLELLRAYAEANDASARAMLVEHYKPLVRKLCRRFLRSNEPQEDLFQIGVIGLLHAIEKFDPDHGGSFSSLAIPEVLGAILNYFRDHGAMLKIPRALRRKRLMVGRASERMVVCLGRWPTLKELAVECGLSEDETCAAIELGRTEQPCSLDQLLSIVVEERKATLLDLVGQEDRHFEKCLERIDLQAALETLPLRERALIRLRFYKGMTQRQTAEQIHVSQMHVSRLERAALAKLRRFLTSARPRPSCQRDNGRVLVALPLDRGGA